MDNDTKLLENFLDSYIVLYIDCIIIWLNLIIF